MIFINKKNNKYILILLRYSQKKEGNLNFDAEKSVD